jgi:DNA-binding NarL/FixJ family response regulator
VTDPCDAVRVAVVAREPLLCKGLALIVESHGAVQIVGCLPSIQDLAALHGGFDVLVVHVVDSAHAGVAAAACAAGTRIVGVHDDMAAPQVAAALAAGLTTLVDTGSAPAALVDAVAGAQERSLLRWSRPAIGPMPLTPRERRVLELIAAGETSRDVAATLGVSARTVEKHKQRIFERLGVQNQAQAVAIALRGGLLVCPAEPARVEARR